MSAQVTLTLTDDVYRRAERLAQRSGHDVTVVLTRTLAAALPAQEENPLGSIIDLSDEAVLALAHSEMDTAQQRRMSALLEHQQAQNLNEVEAFELSLLLFRYQDGSLRKAAALAEAVKRNLIPPLSA